ncbi:mechanosensitive ion channel family protein [Gimesia chilikensis]|uniref:mechanosensitive ion channel family protein n=1 Tax=Gimesia chilikensis TaxID=2605989 RepID=UPI00118A53A1|nr:mechanosensitive ion channel family protein [Gimesia chilikensis]QDT87172.1 Small-conductance mechanosensitive channel [Gimesia chilikensis]
MRLPKLLLFIVLFCFVFLSGAQIQAQETNEKADAKQAEPPSSVKELKPVTTIDPLVPLDQLRIMVRPLTKDELQVEANAWFELLRNKSRQIAAARLGVKKTNEAIATNDDQQALDSLKKAESVQHMADEKARQTEEELTKQAQETLGVDVAVDAARPDPAKAEEGTTASTEEKSATTADSTSTPDNPTTTQSAEAMKAAFLKNINRLQDERTALSDRLEVVLTSLAAKGGDVETYRKYIAAVSGLELDTSDASAAWSGIKGWFVSKEGGQRMGWNLGKFLLILFLTWVVARVGSTVISWLLERKVRLTQLAENLISGTIRNVIYLVGFAVALTALEVDMTPVLAAIGATGLVVGLALQGTLSNFASGLMILINRPFDVGDVVTAGGVTGTVKQMNLVSTNFRTFDNQTIHVPNNSIWNGVITNITANKVRRVDLEFCIGYSDDFEQAEQIIRDVLADQELVLREPEAVVVTHALADSSVNIVCRPWAKTTDWWAVKTAVTREVKRRFDQAGISIPFPQQDIHVYSTDASNGNGKIEAVSK